MLAKVYAAQVSGLRPDIIEIEVDIAQGLHSFSIVGLPDAAVSEAKDRISAAIKNSGFTNPQKGNKKVIVSLAPAHIKKEGPVFDLGIAVSHLLASGEIKFDPAGKLFIGELGLDGSVRGVQGVLPIVEHAAKGVLYALFVPSVNKSEAALIPNVKVYGVNNLKELAEHLDPQNPFEIKPEPRTKLKLGKSAHAIDFADVRGAESAKRGLVIAAAGKHNIAMSGPPGTGKTMLAKAFAGILPPLTLAEALESTGIHSSTGLMSDFITSPPLRSPHHTSSYVALVGGGATPRPGEITLAHNGVLFLDEFPEFDKRVIEALRQPLEDRVVTVSRARGTYQFPANFILVTTMNPCPCGGSTQKFDTNGKARGKPCICSQQALDKYRRKISGPIVDRIDMWVDVPQIDYDKLAEQGASGPSSADLCKRVQSARSIQTKRFKSIKSKNITSNSEMSVKELEQFAPLTTECRSILKQAALKLDLSARAYHRVQKLARTIADLDQSEQIKPAHILEALTYRPKQNN